MVRKFSIYLSDWNKEERRNNGERELVEMAAGITFGGVCGHWERCLHCSLAFILKSLDDNDMSIHFAKHHSYTRT